VGEDEERLLARDFKKAKISQLLGAQSNEEMDRARRPLYSALWQADGTKTRRFAPIDFIGRYMADGFFDYAIADEVHELKGDTAQGNALGTLASCARHVAVLTGTVLGLRRRVFQHSLPAWAIQNAGRGLRVRRSGNPRLHGELRPA
jgi:hypothetical protein